MTTLREIVLVRHGETEGQSSIRYHGATDVPLSDVGREQMRRAGLGLGATRFDLVVSSSLSRAREGAQILAPDRAAEIETDFREIDFGRWEGLTAEEIAAADPELYRAWQKRPGDFEFPEGERRADFRRRVAAGAERLLARRGRSALVVAHKGVVRAIAELLGVDPLAPERPALAEVVRLVHAPSAWRER